MRDYGISTRSVHGGEADSHPYHALLAPVSFCTTFPFADNAEVHAYFQGKKSRGNEYARYGHPTLAQAERKLAELEQAEACLLTASGMAAMTLAILGLLRQGAHVVVTADSYRKTRVFVRDFLKRYGIAHSVVEPSVDAIRAACTDTTRLIISESPTNPYQRCLDCAALGAFARSKRIKTLIDATLATPFNLRPLEHGIDLVVHSCTKYLGGHNDLMAGAILGSSDLISALRETMGMFGCLPGPMTAYLLTRGLKTFALRMRHVNESGMKIARFLEAHPAIERVWYPGLESHPDHAIASKQMAGFSGIVSFTVKGDLERCSRFVDACKLPSLAPTFGGPESLITQPALVSYYDQTSEQRAALGIPDNLVRYCIGLEDADDLIADLDQALKA